MIPTIKYVLLSGKVKYPTLELITSSAKYSGGTTNYREYVGNFVTDSEGNEINIITNSLDKKLYLGKMESNGNYKNIDYPVISTTDLGITLPDLKIATLFKRSDGKLLMFYPEIAVPNSFSCKLKIYRSDNGLGTDFTLIQTFSCVKIPTSSPTINPTSVRVQICREGISDNTLWLTFIGQEVVSSTYVQDYLKILKSTDNGDTWSEVYSNKDSYACKNVSTCVELPNGELIAQMMGSTGSTYVYTSTNGGSTWTKTTMGFSYDGMTFLIQDFLYDKVKNVLYAVSTYTDAASSRRDKLTLFQMNNPTLTRVLAGNWDVVYYTDVTMVYYNFSMYFNSVGELVVQQDASSGNDKIVVFKIS